MTDDYIGKTVSFIGGKGKITKAWLQDNLLWFEVEVECQLMFDDEKRKHIVQMQARDCWNYTEPKGTNG